uniref:transferase hexapeptide repeat family protein n=1 Tax=Ningiella ruwaisensis TaxID=2364274 RepID=UPI0010A00D9E|nr:transferase hexapeptide repeat family protein [Ningiella ruwaisensis]
MPVYAIENLVPVIDPSSYVHATAVLIGDVIIGANCYVGPNAALRGDFGRIILEQGCNVQDNCVIHSFPEQDCVVEQDGHIGHGAVLHGCRIGRNALVGMNAVIMDKAVIGSESLVAATTFVKSGFECPPKSLVVGSPASVKRTLSEKEIAWKTKGTHEYQILTQRCHDSMREVQPLHAVQPARPRFNASHHKPKDEA